MNLAIWDYAPAEFMVWGYTSGRVPSPFDIRRGSIAACTQWLREGVVDVAMTPTLTLLQDPDAFDVVPAVALSTWRYPFARLVLRSGLEKRARRVAYDPAYEQERFLTRLVLKEHYRMDVTFVPHEGASVEALLAADADAALVVGPGVGGLDAGEVVMDLGQEWFELANYPMVWAFFATRKGEATPDVITSLRDAVGAAERHRRLWLRAHETSQRLHEFYTDDLRVRFDDLAVASLTEFRQYLFYYNVLVDMAELPIVFLDEDEDEAGGDDAPGRTPRL